MPRSPCPADNELADYLLGKIDEATAESVDSHIAICADCQTVLTACDVHQDTLLSTFKHNTSVSEFESEPALRSALERAGDMQSRLAASSNINSLAETSIQQLTEFAGLGAGSQNAQLGQYRLLELLGEGGMGTVFVAEQTEPVKRKVALKLIRAGLASSDVVGRFEAERQALAMMNHPNIARVLDGGTTESGQPYFAMELVQGLPITEYCDERKLTTEQRLKLFRDVCGAVQHAHQRGIIHRDLKPSNILVAEIDDTAIVKVIDFGVAKAVNQKLTDQTVYTQFAQMVGTPLYMSPEQAGLGVLDIDTRSDVYSLAVILYELLTERLPYDLDSSMAENLSAIQHVEPKQPRMHGRRIDDEVATIVLRALSKDKERRYAMAGALGEDIVRYLRGDPIEAKRDSILYILRKALRRNIAVAAVAASFLGLILASTAVAWVLYLSADQARQEEATASAQFRMQRDRSRQLRDRSIQQQYVAEMNLAGLAAGKPGGNERVAKLTSKWHPENAPDDLRGWEWFYLRSLCDREIQKFDDQTKQWSCRWSPDGTKLASGGNDGKVRIRDGINGSVERDLIGHRGSVFSLAWSKGGRRLATASVDSTIRVWDTTSGQQLNCFQHSEQFMAVTWGPQSTGLAAATRDGLVRVWNMDKGKETRSISTSMSGISSLHWHPREPWLAAGHADGVVRVWHAGTGESLRELEHSPRAVTGVRWSPDGSRLASVGVGGVTRVSAAATLQMQWQTDSGGQLQSVVWSPDGERLATASQDRSVRELSANSGRVLRHLNGHTDSVWSIDWHPDGQRIASAGHDGTIRVWPGSADSGNRLLRSLGRFNATSVAWSPDGELVATCGSSRTVHILKARTGQHVQRMNRHTSSCRAVRWNADGTLLASTSWDEKVILWDPHTGRQSREFDGHVRGEQVSWENVVHCVCWSPDGKRLVSGGHDPTMYVWDARTGKLITRFSKHRAIVDSVDWHPTLNLVVSCSHDGKILVWNPESGELSRAPVSAHSDVANDVRWNPDGRTFASAGADGTARIWAVASGELVRTFTGHFGPVRCVRWNADGNRLATCSPDGTVRIWSPASDSELLTINVSSEIVQGIDWSPDGKQLISVDLEGDIRIWDATIGYENELPVPAR